MGESNKKIVIAVGGIAGLTAEIYARLAVYEADIYKKRSRRSMYGVESERLSY